MSQERKRTRETPPRNSQVLSPRHPKDGTLERKFLEQGAEGARDLRGRSRRGSDDFGWLRCAGRWKTTERPGHELRKMRAFTLEGTGTKGEEGVGRRLKNPYRGKNGYPPGTKENTGWTDQVKREWGGRKHQVAFFSKLIDWYSRKKGDRE